MLARFSTASPAIRGLPGFWVPPLFLAGAGVVLYLLGLDALLATSHKVAGIPLFYRQLAWGAIAALAASVCYVVPFRYYRRLAAVAWVVSLVLLAAVLTQRPINGARAWFRLGPISLQASELAKITVPLALAAWYSRRRPERLINWAGGAAIVTLPVALIATEPDIGNAIVLVPSWLAVFLASRPRWPLVMLQFLLFAAASLAAIPLLTPEQRARVVSFATQSDFANAPTGEGYQLFQAKRAVMLAGLFGSQEACDVHVPMAHNDFVFTLLVARRGLVGAAAVLICFACLIWSLTVMAATVRSRFAAYYLIAVAAWLGTQVSINVCMTVGLAPITGITLPLVSYGGTSLVVTCCSLAIAACFFRDQLRLGI